MKKLKGYWMYILRADNDLDKKYFANKPGKKVKKFEFEHRGFLYEFDSECSFSIHDYTSVWYWILPEKIRRYDRLLLYREPDENPPPPEQTPVRPLGPPMKTNSIEESPLILKGVTRSKLKQTYRAKQKFPTFFPKLPWWAWLLLAGSIIFCFFMLTGGMELIPKSMPSMPKLIPGGT